MNNLPNGFSISAPIYLFIIIIIIIFFKKKKCIRLFKKFFLIVKKERIDSHTNSFNTEKYESDAYNNYNGIPSKLINYSKWKCPNVQQDGLFPIISNPNKKTLANDKSLLKTHLKQN